ncbi:MAG: hypothetical protein APG12_00239 [Candidatus Methanofastidiosum methylothiophilum]|uniref:Uncharacterized protein n=1 Tax=Candidatus Methanofastidiosum methylothiophilum TaxID=1705564 RepID=A0A150IPB7_9EURY|nr:MAG: hypothetical protein APG10_01743 [Candidatus Methanofastidiosum methylthiophilus]KYC46504.1 MAG: hypothetical protein APG11_01852 [Candidatus Methanofastidiosum methylthiophilus]KYC51313.1 MAG: hypothetical protein APG12_00239 [Candidatus Methanofastidiosum methylthiophilus]
MKEFCYNCDKVTEMEEIEDVFDEETSVTNKAFKNSRSVEILTIH